MQGWARRCAVRVHGLVIAIEGRPCCSGWSRISPSMPDRGLGPSGASLSPERGLFARAASCLRLGAGLGLFGRGRGDDTACPRASARPSPPGAVSDRPPSAAVAEPPPRRFFILDADQGGEDVVHAAAAYGGIEKRARGQGETGLGEDGVDRASRRPGSTGSRRGPCAQMGAHTTCSISWAEAHAVSTQSVSTRRAVAQGGPSVHKPVQQGPGLAHPGPGAEKGVVHDQFGPGPGIFSSGFTASSHQHVGVVPGPGGEASLPASLRSRAGVAHQRGPEFRGAGGVIGQGGMVAAAALRERARRCVDRGGSAGTGPAGGWPGPPRVRELRQTRRNR